MGKNHLMRLITLHLPASWVQMLDEAVRRGFAPNRSELIRNAIRNDLHDHKVWKAIEVSPRLMEAILGKLSDIEEQ